LLLLFNASVAIVIHHVGLIVHVEKIFTTEIKNIAVYYIKIQEKGHTYTLLLLFNASVAIIIHHVGLIVHVEKIFTTEIKNIAVYYINFNI